MNEAVVESVESSQTQTDSTVTLNLPLELFSVRNTSGMASLNPGTKLNMLRIR